METQIWFYKGMTSNDQQILVLPVGVHPVGYFGVDFDYKPKPWLAWEDHEIEPGETKEMYIDYIRSLCSEVLKADDLHAVYIAGVHEIEQDNWHYVG